MEGKPKGKPGKGQGRRDHAYDTEGKGEGGASYDYGHDSDRWNDSYHARDHYGKAGKHGKDGTGKRDGRGGHADGLEYGRSSDKDYWDDYGKGL